MMGEKFICKSSLSVAPLLTALLTVGALGWSEPVRALEPLQESMGDRIKASNNNQEFYNQARAALPEDFYVLYRIVERLARANGLDERPWRLRLSGEYEVNAYASELNTLTFMAGLLDQLHGDTAALACVVGHEMAHHTQDHIPTMVAVQTQMGQLMAEAEAEAIAEIQNAQRQQAATNTIGSILGSVLGSVIGGSTGAIVGGTTQAVLGTMTASQRQQAEVRAREIYEQKVAALGSEYSAVLQSQEFEADEFGFQYLVRAGFDPQGCVRAMNTLDQLEHSRLPSLSHPMPAVRIRQLQALNTAANVNALTAEGTAYLRQSSQPLKYGISRDGVSLRIESRYGSSGGFGFPD
ncbi:MAG TPA: M48 family metalloprotease [Leptolyngbyaceae cyanobacterium M65_K2018_010]|nr:M48 family metalloprotease [Leptolyngbyaceae cyanobacterium M65_K2018_010]